MEFISLIEVAHFRPARLEPPDSWIGHIPFAAWLIQTIKPSIFVELGTHSGNSYLAFCQAVKEGKLPTKCYAIDAWKGDEHSSFYGEEVFLDLNSYHEKHYAIFSRLLRMTFDEAAPYFTDGSIGLLHIDGLHTYEAVKHDFETWLPKLTPHAIVIFHDANVRERGFGTWRFWLELCQQYPLNFEFDHGHGLRVLQLSKGQGNFDLEWLQPDFTYRQMLKEYFVNLGQHAVEQYRKQEIEKSLYGLRQASDKVLTELQTSQVQLAEREQITQALQVQLIEREEISQALQAQLTEREEIAHALQAQLTEREEIAQASQAKLTELEQTGQVLQAQLKGREQQTSILFLQKIGLEQELTNYKDHLNQREQILQDLNSKLLEIYSSTAWKIIRWMWKVRLWLAPKGSKRERTAKGILNLFLKTGSKSNSSGLQSLNSKGQSFEAQNQYDQNPIVPSVQIQLQAKSPIQTREKADSQEVYEQFLKVARGEREPEYVDLSEIDLSLKDLPVKLIAFYLPQYHPIPENDVNWGKGFTEWTNVSKAVPQFAGHYQPRLPGELGFYDLRLPEIQRRQVELAKKYGIYGFCFHYYWFSGRKLLEGPLNQFISDPRIDFPFCICWANENWTRRWDGLEDEILIKQEHSLENDYKFIHDIEPLLRHPNYIKLGDRPIIVVYRTRLLEDARKTAATWREYCIEQGLGIPYLVAAQTVGFYDPNPIGFDAAVEFPPINIACKQITDEVDILNSQYTGNVYSYVEMMHRYIETPVNEAYRVIKSVCPSWDNEPRKPGRGVAYIYCTPGQYQRWLSQCIIRETINHPENSGFVFINAWNEWGECAYLEPDRKYGYAYLDATSKALCSAAATIFIGPEGSIPCIEKTIKSDTAVVLHLYYEDLFEEIKKYLKNLDDFDLYISIPDSLEGIEEKIFSSFPAARVLKTENRGRDMAPFISILRVISEMNYQYLLKIHTKKSTHRNDGEIWRNDVYHKLMGSKENINAIMDEFRKNKGVGIIGPEQHVVDHSIYWGSNEMLTRTLAACVGIRVPLDPDFVFVAGSMFWARLEALKDLILLPLDIDGFEPEPLPPDGTLAHALERFLGLSVLHRGYSILEIDEAGNITDPKTKSEGIYPFAVPSSILSEK